MPDPMSHLGQLGVSGDSVPLRIDEAQLALAVLTRFASEPAAREKASSLVTLGVAISATASESGCSDAEVAFALHRAIEAYRVGGHVPPVGAGRDDHGY